MRFFSNGIRVALNLDVHEWTKKMFETPVNNLTWPEATAKRAES